MKLALAKTFKKSGTRDYQQLFLLYALSAMLSAYCQMFLSSFRISKSMAQNDLAEIML